MNGIVTPPRPNPLMPDTPPGEDDLIQVDAFWPAISLAALRDAERIQSDIPDARLRKAVAHALLEITRELRAWRGLQEAAGHDTLADVPARQMIGDRTDFELLWERAVQSVVAADLGERLLTQTSTSAGLDRAEPALSQAERLQRNVSHAVRDFLGVGRARVSLV